MLLARGGNASLCDGAGWSPLHWAAHQGHTDVCRLLLLHGASRLAQDNVSRGAM